MANNNAKKPPVVVIMGHIDHGKTTLLDYIRKASVAEKEIGGITQAIGAYEIEHNGERITFIDTPGHQAFSKMRSHGAKVADIAILVVAANDGVKPETKDALKHIKEAGIPFIIAVNKIDLPEANLEKTYQELGQAEVFLERRGGDVSFQPISAKTGEGINELLDLLILTVELEELTHNQRTLTSGVILTSTKNPKRGVLAGAVLKNGELKIGDEVFTQTSRGKIKSIEDFKGNKVKSANPSSPVLLSGFEHPPLIGEVFQVGKSPHNPPAIEKKIKATDLEKEGSKLVLKADESGSLDVLRDFVISLSTDELPIFVVSTGIGNINENDIKMAFSSGATIIGFQVKVDRIAGNMAKMQKVNIITSSIIYELEESLKTIFQEKIKKSGRVFEILKTFGKSKGNQVVGGRVAIGPIRNQERFEIIEDEKVVGSGKIINLQHGKEDINVVEEGKEAGMMVSSSIEIKEDHRLIFANS